MSKIVWLSLGTMQRTSVGTWSGLKHTAQGLIRRLFSHLCQPVRQRCWRRGQVSSPGQDESARFLHEEIRYSETILEWQVGAAEKAKLEQHLAAYESMRQRQSRVNEIESRLRTHAPVISDKYKSDVETDRHDAHFDLVAASLIGGLNNVVTLTSGAGDPYFSIRSAGWALVKHHIGHGGKYNGLTADTMPVTIRRFHFELIGRLMKKPEAVTEGNGTMLDNTLILYTSDADNANCLEWPFVALPGPQGDRYTTFLHALGDKREYYGPDVA